jgi:hypothetical protein
MPKNEKNGQNNYYFYIKKEIGTKFVLCAKIFLSSCQNNKKTNTNILLIIMQKIPLKKNKIT